MNQNNKTPQRRTSIGTHIDTNSGSVQNHHKIAIDGERGDGYRDRLLQRMQNEHQEVALTDNKLRYIMSYQETVEGGGQTLDEIVVKDGSEAMDAHTRISESTKRPTSTDVFQQRLLWHQSIWEQNGYNIKIDLNNPKQRQAIVTAVNVAIEREHALLNTAQTIYVSTEILQEMFHAATTMPDNVLLQQDIFVPNGLLIFESPIPYTLSVGCEDIPFTDGSGNMLNVPSQIEMYAVHAVHFNIFGRTNKPSDPVGDYLNLLTDPEHADGIEVTLYGQWRGQYDIEQNKTILYNPKMRAMVCTDGTPPEDYLEKLDGMPLAKGEFEFIQKYAEGKPTHFIDATVLDFNKDNIGDIHLNDFKKCLIALFRMTYSYLAQTQEEVPRHVLKRAKRANRKILENGYLTVLRLRRTEHEKTGVAGSSPRIAFRVRGHWKRVFHRSFGHPVGDPRAYRHMYVNDYIKGAGTGKKFVESERLIKITN